MMISLTIPGMTCGRCARSITTAIQSIDAQAEVETDVPERRVTIESTATMDSLLGVIREAGYEVEAT